MPRRDRSGEYAARDARAVAQGYSGYNRGPNPQRRARREGRPLPADPVARTMTPVETPAGRIAGSGSPAYIIDEIARAAAAGRHVQIQATFNAPYDLGHGPRTKYLDRVPPTLLRFARNAGPGGLVGQAPDLGAPLAPGRVGAGKVRKGQAGSPVQVITGDAGMDPDDVLTIIDAFDGDPDPWAWLAAIWDDEYRRSADAAA